MAKIIVNPTSSARREFALSRTLVSIGRDPSNDVVLPDAMVSRRHAVIEYRGAQYYIRDCNSSNGSLVNGDRVSERSLRDGDLVAIGTARLLFRDDLGLDEPGAKVVLHPSAPRQQCPACQAEYRKGDLFCRQCGGAVASAPPKSVCNSCGTAVLLPARFCNACGQVLPDEGAFRDTPRPVDAEVTSSGPVLPGLGAVTLRPQEPPEEVPTALPDATGANVTGASPIPRLTVPAPFGARLLAGLCDGLLVLAVQALVLTPGILYWRSRELPSEVAVPRDRALARPGAARHRPRRGLLPAFLGRARRRRSDSACSTWRSRARTAAVRPASRARSCDCWATGSRPACSASASCSSRSPAVRSTTASRAPAWSAG